MKNLQLLAIAAAVVVLGYASDEPESRLKPYVPPVMRESEAAGTAIFALPVPPRILDGPPPVLRHTTPDYPADFVEDSVAYLESRLGQWQQIDAAGVLGIPLRQRPSVDDEGKPNGAVYAYADPSIVTGNSSSISKAIRASYAPSLFIPRK